MKKFLSISCFLFLQTISCEFGKIDAQPEATELIIKNNSSVPLLNVIWNGSIPVDISLGGYKKMDVSPGEFPIHFKSNGKQYRTQTPVSIKKYERKEFNFIDYTLVIDVETSKEITLSTLGGTLNVD